MLGKGVGGIRPGPQSLHLPDGPNKVQGWIVNHSGRKDIHCGRGQDSRAARSSRTRDPQGWHWYQGKLDERVDGNSETDDSFLRSQISHAI